MTRWAATTGGSAGVEDAAAEVRALQRKGLRVSAVFMGEDASAADASRIYGKNMARIRGMDQLARPQADSSRTRYGSWATES